AHERGQVEGYGQPAATVGQQILVALVGLLRRGKPGELAHGPQLAPVAAGMDAARVGWLAGIVQVLLDVPVLGEVGLGIETTHRLAAERGKAGVAVLVEIDAAGRADRLFWSFFECLSKSGFGPALLRFGGMTSFKNLAHRTVRQCALIFLFPDSIRHIEDRFSASIIADYPYRLGPFLKCDGPITESETPSSYECY